MLRGRVKVVLKIEITGNAGASDGGLDSAGLLKRQAGWLLTEDMLPGYRRRLSDISDFIRRSSNDNCERSVKNLFKRVAEDRVETKTVIQSFRPFAAWVIEGRDGHFGLLVKVGG